MTTFFSPAKINISLKVGPKRKDGYHDINTHVQTISLGDLIEFSQGVTDSFSSSSQDIPLDSSNLVIKARDLFRETTSCTHPLNIYLQKKNSR